MQSYVLPNVIDMNLIILKKFTLKYALYTIELVAQVGIQGMGILTYVSTLVLNVKPIERQYICYSSARKRSAYNI